MLQHDIDKGRKHHQADIHDDIPTVCNSAELYHEFCPGQDRPGFVKNKVFDGDGDHAGDQIGDQHGNQAAITVAHIGLFALEIAGKYNEKTDTADGDPAEAAGQPHGDALLAVGVVAIIQEGVKYHHEQHGKAADQIQARSTFF